MNIKWPSILVKIIENFKGSEFSGSEFSGSEVWVFGVWVFVTPVFPPVISACSSRSFKLSSAFRLPESSVVSQHCLKFSEFVPFRYRYFREGASNEEIKKTLPFNYNLVFKTRNILFITRIKRGCKLPLLGLRSLQWFAKFLRISRLVYIQIVSLGYLWSMFSPRSFQGFSPDLTRFWCTVDYGGTLEHV